MDEEGRNEESTSSKMTYEPGTNGKEANATDLAITDNSIKGKEKDESSNAGRIWASGEAMLGAARSSLEPIGSSTQSKDLNRPSPSKYMELHREMGTKERWHGASSPVPGRAFKPQINGGESAPAFESFVNTVEAPANIERHQLADQPYLRHGDFTIAQQEARDGSAVVDLLSQEEELPSGTEVGEDVPLSREESARLRKALFDTGSSWPFWDQMLNFTPNALTLPTDGGEQAHALVGMPEADTARTVWLRQWNDVLSSYTDAVWGDLGPLVEEAKHEVEELEDTEMSGNMAEAKAVERLRLVLAHVRGH